MRVTLLVGITATVCVALSCAKSLPSESHKSSRSRTTDGEENNSLEAQRNIEDHHSTHLRSRKPTPDETSEDVPQHRSQKNYNGDVGFYSHHQVVDKDEDLFRPHHKNEESHHRSRKPNRASNYASRKKMVDSDQISEASEDENGLDGDSDNDVDPATRELLAIARNHAIQVIVEKMLIAFGPDFIEESRGAANNSLMPTVSSPLNITTEPCPEIYAQCSSEIFLTSCKPPKHSHKGLWKQRFNLYFDLPTNLWETDELLASTLRVYKHGPLPLKTPTTLIVEIYMYTKSLTLKRDWNILINSTKVASDFVGWVSLDLTELTRNLEPKKNHGFLIKVRDINGILWNAPEIFEPMDCSDSNKSLVAFPFGVETEEPEQKFPSLTITTGKLDHYYSELGEETQNYEDYDSLPESRKENELIPLYKKGDPVEEYLENDQKEMPSDDPFVHHKGAAPSRYYEEDESDSQNARHLHTNSFKDSHQGHPRKTHSRQPPTSDRQSEEEEAKRSNVLASISSLEEEEETVSSTKRWKKASSKDSLPAIYDTQVIVTRQRPHHQHQHQHQQQHPQQHRKKLPEAESNSPLSRAHSEEERHHETRHRHQRPRSSSEQRQLHSSS